MPVHEYTNATGGFWKLGAIHKGAPKTENGPGKDLDYFRMTYMPGKKARELEAAFLAAYGPKPTDINVRLNGLRVSDVWDVNYVCYKQGGLIAQAGSNINGPYWIYYRDPENIESILVRGGAAVGMAGREFMDKPIDLTAPIYYNAKKEPQCLELEGRLQVVIPELKHLEVGYFEFVPGSPRDLRNISSELAAYEAVAKAFGKTINGIPFRLLRREEQIPKNIKGKLVRGPSWVVHLTASSEYASRALEVIERMALPDVVEGEVVEPAGPEWDAGFDEEPAPAPEAPKTPELPAVVPEALPNTREALVTIFSKEYNTAAKKVDPKTLPTLKGNATIDELKEAIEGLRAAVAAA